AAAADRPRRAASAPDRGDERRVPGPLPALRRARLPLPGRPAPAAALRRRLGGADHQDVRALPARPSEPTGRHTRTHFESGSRAQDAPEDEDAVLVEDEAPCAVPPEGGEAYEREGGRRAVEVARLRLVGGHPGRVAQDGEAEDPPAGRKVGAERVRRAHDGVTGD